MKTLTRPHSTLPYPYLYTYTQPITIHTHTHTHASTHTHTRTDRPKNSKPQQREAGAYLRYDQDLEPSQKKVYCRDREEGTVTESEYRKETFKQ